MKPLMSSLQEALQAALFFKDDKTSVHKRPPVLGLPTGFYQILHKY